MFLVGTTRLHPLLPLIFIPLDLAQLGGLLLRCPRMGPQLTRFPFLPLSQLRSDLLLASLWQQEPSELPQEGTKEKR